MRFFNIMIIVAIFLLFFALPCNAKNNIYSNISTNKKINQALEILATHNKMTYETFNILMGKNLTKKSVKIMFWSLEELNYSYRNLDALNCHDENGNIVILIDKSHSKAPAEAIASLLAHEAIHQDEFTSKEEEVEAWTKEAIVWNSLKPKLSEINTDCNLVKRLNKIEKMYYTNNNNNEIREVVASNIFYKNLPSHSPGFGI